MTKYRGKIVRKYFGACNGEIMQTVSSPIIVEAHSREAAELFMHEEYGYNQRKYTPGRTSDTCKGDKVFVMVLKR